MERYIDTNIFLSFSPNENIWYLERRETGNWAVSEQNFESEIEAVKAYQEGYVKWEAARLAWVGNF